MNLNELQEQRLHQFPIQRKIKKDTWDKIDMSIFDTLKKLQNEQSKEIERKDPSYIFLDEKDNQIKETKISELLDSSASAYINKVMNTNSLELIHDSIFGNSR
jgi:hypothetical protein